MKKQKITKKQKIMKKMHRMDNRRKSLKPIVKDHLGINSRISPFWEWLSKFISMAIAILINFHPKIATQVTPFTTDSSIELKERCCHGSFVILQIF